MSKCTILTVEDEPAISDILRVNLTFVGYDVLSAKCHAGGKLIKQASQA